MAGCALVGICFSFFALKKSNPPRKKARTAGPLSRACCYYCVMDFDDIEVLDALIDQMNRSTAHAEKALDAALDFVARSEKRIALLELDAQKKRHPKVPFL